MIEITGTTGKNLKKLSLRIPKEQLVVLTGVSGSGKSSLAFDTIAQESSRQWQETLPLYLRSRMPHHRRPDVDAIQGLTPLRGGGSEAHRCQRPLHRRHRLGHRVAAADAVFPGGQAQPRRTGSSTSALAQETGAVRCSLRERPTS